MNWTVEQLLGEIAAMRVRLEEMERDSIDRIHDVLYMMTLIIGNDHPLYLKAQAELEKLQREEKGEDSADVLGYSHWYMTHQPVLDEKADPKPFSFNDLVRDFPLNSFATFWHQSVNPDGDDVLICGIDPLAEVYYVTRHPGVEGQVVYVRDADDKVDQLNRDQMPWFKENMK